MKRNHLTDQKEIQKFFEDLNYIHLEDIPNIPLYMDQLTSFINTQLESQRRYPEDKILTKTMINNYSKHKLLPPSDNKKYNQDHIILLSLIYYLKGFLSINDIKKLLSPLSNQSLDLSAKTLYKNLTKSIKEYTPELIKDILHKKEVANQLSSQEDTQNKNLEDLTFIALLSFDIHLKKKLIEAWIDHQDANE